MAKIMLVEDDNNLREIYEARLLAEGYEIVSAKDGEEALALAVKEKPDLIISDVMMPKISGFDMLDILRSTPETKNTKVVMMTALSQADDKKRAEKLGADRYLVKSQVTLEDVARVAREVLDGTGGETPSGAAPVASSPAGPINVATPPAQAPVDPPAPTTTPEPPTVPTPAVEPPDPEPSTPATPPVPAEPDANLAQPTVSEEKQVDKQIDDFVSKANAESAVPPNSAETIVSPADSSSSPNLAVPDEIAKQIAVMDAPDEDKGTNNDSKVTPVTTISPSQPKLEEHQPTQAEILADSPKAGPPDREQEEGDDVPIAHKKVIQPIGDPTKKPDLDALVAQEEANDTTLNPGTDSVINPVDDATTVTDTPSAENSATSGTVITPSDPNAVAL